MSRLFRTGFKQKTCISFSLLLFMFNSFSQGINNRLIFLFCVYFIMVSFAVPIKLFPSVPLTIYKPSFSSPTVMLIE